ncbi:hypothetical protein V6Z11_D10G251200 [Gossypium hirsutum]
MAPQILVYLFFSVLLGSRSRSCTVDSQIFVIYI